MLRQKLWVMLSLVILIFVLYGLWIMEKDNYSNSTLCALPFSLVLHWFSLRMYFSQIIISRMSQTSNNFWNLSLKNTLLFEQRFRFTRFCTTGASFLSTDFTQFEMNGATEIQNLCKILSLDVILCAVAWQNFVNLNSRASKNIVSLYVNLK